MFHALVVLGTLLVASGAYARTHIEAPIIRVVAVEASSAQPGNGAPNAIDTWLGSRWSAQGEGEWIIFDLGESIILEEMAIAWYQGKGRTFTFDIEISEDKATWSRIFSGFSSAQTDKLETYGFANSWGRFVRIVGYGNTKNNWNSIREVQFWHVVWP